MPRDTGNQSDPGTFPDIQFSGVNPVEFDVEQSFDSSDEADERREQKPAARDNGNPASYDMSAFSHQPIAIGQGILTPEDGQSDLNPTPRGPETAFGTSLETGGVMTNASRSATGREDEEFALGELTRNPEPVAGPPPTQVNPIEGTDDDDVLLANTGNIPANWTRTVSAFGGNDYIIRDQTGYNSKDVEIDGGTGFDMVSYASANDAVFVSLATSAAIVDGSIDMDQLTSIEGINGTAFGDFLFGSAADNQFLGNDGNDTIDGLGGDDTLWGHAGEDTINGGEGDDLIYGGDDDDELNGGAGSDTVYGGDGDDDIDGGNNDDTLRGEDGNDTIAGGHGDDVIYDGIGNDDVTGGVGDDAFYIDDGNDEFSGGSGDDRFYVDGFGNNIINGGANTDTVIFGNAAVIVNLDINWAQRGAEGVDTITGVENIMSGNGADILAGTSSHNFIHAGGGGDLVSGLSGDDTIDGAAGADTLWGGDGGDDLTGGSGDDEMWGQDGVDEMYGNSGDDTLNGGDDSDQISGGTGEDRVRGGAGEDWMLGGADADTFVWNAGDADVPAIDQILDFDVNEDMFSFGAGFFDVGPGPVNLSSVLMAVPHAGSDALLWADTDTGAGWQVIARLEGVSAAELNVRIQNGTILDVESNFEGPGQLEFEQQHVVQAEPIWDIMA